MEVLAEGRLAILRTREVLSDGVGRLVEAFSLRVELVASMGHERRQLAHETILDFGWNRRSLAVHEWKELSS